MFVNRKGIVLRGIILAELSNVTSPGQHPLNTARQVFGDDKLPGR